MKLKKTFLAMLFLSFISSSGVVAAAPEQGPAYRKFVIYYGWYSDEDGKHGPDIDRIIRSKPEYVVSPYYTTTGDVNLKSEILKKFHDNGIRVLVYIATGNAGRDLDIVLSEMKTALQAGADGVMVDEVASLHTESQRDYYKQIYDYTKSFGTDRVVVANPGTITVSESVMSVSDLVSFEHEWRLAPAIDWFSRYPPARFMGVSSNEITGVMGYAVDDGTAVSDTVEAWQSGIGYHFSTDTYTSLAPWFEDYQKALDDFVLSGAKLHEVKVATVDTEGKEIKGLWIEVRKNNRVMVTGFTPTKFMLPEGNYQVGAPDYQNFIFSKWKDGDTAPYHSFLVTGDSPLEITAIYRNEMAELHVESYDNLGNSIKGLPLSVSRDGTKVATGFTSLRLNLPLGTYTVTASSNKYYEFLQWGDSSKANSTAVKLVQNTKLRVDYHNSPADQLGEGIFGCQKDYRKDVAESMLREGPFAGFLELHMRKSTTLNGAVC